MNALNLGVLRWKKRIIPTNEHSFRDDFFTDASAHDSEGKNIMLLGVDVLPEYREHAESKTIRIGVGDI